MESGINFSRAEATAQVTVRGMSKMSFQKKSNGTTTTSATNTTTNETGKVYKVPGKDTQTGKPYVGRTKQVSPAKIEHGANDGRDRSNAEIIDTYDPSNGKEGSFKEQWAINANGGVQNLDNKRNIMSKQNYKEAKRNMETVVDSRIEFFWSWFNQNQLNLSS